MWPQLPQYVWGHMGCMRPCLKVTKLWSFIRSIYKCLCHFLLCSFLINRHDFGRLQQRADSYTSASLGLSGISSTEVYCIQTGSKLARRGDGGSTPLTKRKEPYLISQCTTNSSPELPRIQMAFNVTTELLLYVLEVWTQTWYQIYNFKILLNHLKIRCVTRLPSLPLIEPQMSTVQIGCLGWWTFISLRRSKEGWLLYVDHTCFEPNLTKTMSIFKKVNSYNILL